MWRSLFQRAGTECFGTYALVTAGCGAIMVMVAATGHISGAHFNPAVTIAFALTRHFAWRDVPVYIGSQVIGAIEASKNR